VAVSKTKPIPDLMQAYEAGQRIFGENKIQEMERNGKMQRHSMAHDRSCSDQ
jgi:uncharacterized pyridoxal phosphate-containing UPF0001 family protein